jgi:hypothetical protein
MAKVQARMHLGTAHGLREGHCAVDPKRIHYGSKVIFSHAACVAVDTGPDVVSRKAARSGGRQPAERKAIVIDRFSTANRRRSRGRILIS